METEWRITKAFKSLLGQKKGDEGEGQSEVVCAAAACDAVLRDDR